MLSISCHLLSTVLKVNNTKVGCGMVVSVSVVHPGDGPAGRGCRCPALWECVCHRSSPGKGHNSKFKVQFLLCGYCSRTVIKSKHLESSRCKSVLCSVPAALGTWPCSILHSPPGCALILCLRVPTLHCLGASFIFCSSLLAMLEKPQK